MEKIIEVQVEKMVEAPVIDLTPPAEVTNRTVQTELHACHLEILDQLEQYEIVPPLPTETERPSASGANRGAQGLSC